MIRRYSVPRTRTSHTSSQAWSQDTTDPPWVTRSSIRALRRNPAVNPRSSPARSRPGSSSIRCRPRPDSGTGRRSHPVRTRPPMVILASTATSPATSATSNSSTARFGERASPVTIAAQSLDPSPGVASSSVGRRPGTNGTNRPVTAPSSHDTPPSLATRGRACPWPGRLAVQSPMRTENMSGRTESAFACPPRRDSHPQAWSNLQDARWSDPGPAQHDPRDHTLLADDLDQAVVVTGQIVDAAEQMQSGHVRAEVLGLARLLARRRSRVSFELLDRVRELRTRSPTAELPVEW